MRGRDLFTDFHLFSIIKNALDAWDDGDKGIVVSSRFRLFFYSFLTRLLSERVYIQRIPLGEFESFSVFIVESINIVNLQYFL